MNWYIFVKSFHFPSPLSVPHSQLLLKCPTNISPFFSPDQCAVSIKRGNLWSEHLLSPKNMEVPILQLQACISPSRTFFWLTFNVSVDLPWSNSPRWPLHEELSSSHLHFRGKSMRKEWMANSPAVPQGPFFPGGGIPVFKKKVLLPKLNLGNVVLITDPSEQPDPSHQDSDNEPRHGHQVPGWGGGDPSVLPLMSNSSLPSLRNGILLHTTTPTAGASAPC